MGKQEVTDLFLYKYMKIVDETIINTIENQVDQEYTFSKGFEEKMKKVIREEEQMRLNVLKGIARKVAVLLIALLGAFMAVTMSVEAYREKFFSHIKNIFEDSFVNVYFVENEVEVFEEYDWEYIPEGYSLVDKKLNENASMKEYGNATGDLITLDQLLISNQSKIHFDLEYLSEDKIIINENILIIYSYEEEFKSAYYEYENYVFILTSDTLDMTEIEMVFSNLKKK